MQYFVQARNNSHGEPRVPGARIALIRWWGGDRRRVEKCIRQKIPSDQPQFEKKNNHRTISSQAAKKFIYNKAVWNWVELEERLSNNRMPKISRDTRSNCYICPENPTDVISFLGWFFIEFIWDFNVGIFVVSVCGNSDTEIQYSVKTVQNVAMMRRAPCEEFSHWNVIFNLV